MPPSFDKAQRLAILTLFASGFVCPHLVGAATPFSENFSGNSLPTNLEKSSGTNVSFASGKATWTTGTGDRSYLRTIQSDYHGSDFVFEATVDIRDGADADGSAFMGIGSAIPDSGHYLEPATPHAFADIGPDGFANGFFRSRDNATASGTQGQGTGWDGVHRLRLTWTAATGTALFEVDKDYAGGAFITNYSVQVDASNNGLNDSNSKLFFGGADGVVWDDIAVTVTPAAPPVTHANLVISEFLASNGGGILDGDGDSSDWIEIYNGTGSSVALAGWHLSDDASALGKWSFPAGTSIEHGEYLIVWASNKISPPAGEHHTSFKLSSGGEYLALSEPGAAVVADHWFPAADGTPPAQKTDISYGDSDDWSSTGYLDPPTPGAPNGPAFAGFVSDTQFSIDRGSFTTPQSVAITTLTPDAQIRYTTDGSTPTESHGTFYNNPVDISETTVLRAAAFKSGFRPTDVDTHTYLFLDDVVTQTRSSALADGWPAGSVNGQTLDYGLDPDIVSGNETELKTALGAIPSLSIVTDRDKLVDASDGIYVNASGDGRSWERPASFELIGTDGAGAFQANGGLRIRGGYSRVSSNPKHAFRLFFRSEYGDKRLSYPLFGDEGAGSFKRVDLRCAQGFSWNLWGQETQRGSQNNYLRDVVARYTQAATGQPYTRSRFYHLYLNGHYWGLYQTQERPEANFGESYLGGGVADDEDFDTIKTDQLPGGAPFTSATDGTLDAFNELWSNSHRAKVAGSNSNYFALQGLAADGTTATPDPVLLDVDNLADYMLCTFYTASYDAPISEYVAGNSGSHNWYSVRNRVAADRGFAFFVHDFENSFNVVDPNIPLDRRLDRTGPFNHSRQNDVLYANPAWIHQELCHNAEYRIAFADRAHRHLFGNGAMTDAVSLARYDAWASTVESVIIAESARWGDSRRTSPYTAADWASARDTTRAFLPGRAATVVAQLRAYDDGGGLPLYPSIDAPGVQPFGGPIATGFKPLLTATAGNIYYTLDGSDPRAVGGAPATGASVISNTGSTPVTLVSRGDDWMFLDDGSAQSTSEIDRDHPDWSSADWKHPSFADGTWGGGPAPLGFGGLGSSGNTLPIETTVSGGIYTTWFRKIFDVTDASTITALTLELLRDDGAVVYLNGVEIKRSNLPAGIVAHNTPATSGITGGAEVSYHQWTDIAPSLLVDGANTLAVEVHQSASTSSDLGFDLSLVADQAAGSAGITIGASGTLKARALHNGEWSALTEADFLVGELATAANLVVSEIMYNPAGGAESTEFIELLNISDAPISLGGVRFTRGVEFTFPVDSSLPAGGRVLVVRERAAFAAGLNIAGEFEASTGLANGGEQLRIEDRNGVEVRDFTYDDNPDWPTAPDGDGYSLVLVAPETDPPHGDPHSWRSSTAIAGNPGISDAGAPFSGDPDLDADADGLGAFMEHAIGSSDAVPNPDDGPSLGSALFDDGSGTMREYLTITYRRDLAADDVIFEAQVATDLAAWSTLGTAYVSGGHNADGTETVTYRSTTPLASIVREFIRLKMRSR